MPLLHGYGVHYYKSTRRYSHSSGLGQLKKALEIGEMATLKTRRRQIEIRKDRTCPKEGEGKGANAVWVKEVFGLRGTLIFV
jgi:hypothetical protein